jgi:hypothetical protein
MRSELQATLRTLLASAPLHDAQASDRANYALRKAEFLDYVSVAEPALTATAALAAVRARNYAQDIALGF